MKKSKNKDHIRILKYFKDVKFQLILLVILMLMISGVHILSPIVNAKLLTNITEFNKESAIIYALLFFVLMIFSVLVNKITTILYLTKIKNKIVLNIRKDMLKSIFKMKIFNFDNHTSGEYIERLRNDPEDISNILSIVQYSLFCMITDLCILGYVFFINPIIGLIYLCCIVSIYIYEKIAFKNYEKLYKQKKESQEKNSTLSNEIMRGIRDIKVLDISNKIFPVVSSSLEDSTKYESKMQIKYESIVNTNEIIKSLTTVFIIIVGIFLVSIDELSITGLLIIFMYRNNIFDLVFSYTSMKEQYTKYKLASSRIFEIMDNDKFPEEKYGKQKIENINGKIELKNLSFAYGKKKVLKDINLVINPNDTIGIVGTSGSGKTTLLNVISKCYDVDDSQLFIDNIDINQLNRDSIRDNISVISQNPYIFNLTIKDNLKLMGTNITDQEMIEACKVAQTHDFIEQLPNKYDSLLGESGTNLSGGQKQRLAIARALLRKTKIILFDEATSALDNITQTELQKSINNISNDYTIVIVAHRLSTIKSCNVIYVIDDGKIVGSGNHEELLKTNDYYKKLYYEELN